MPRWFRDLDHPGRRLCQNPWPEVRRQGPMLWRVADAGGTVLVIQASSASAARLIAAERLRVPENQLRATPLTGGPGIL
jgi:hypothetical protein